MPFADEPRLQMNFAAKVALCAMFTGFGWIKGARAADLAQPPARSLSAVKAQILVELAAYIRWPPRETRESKFVIAIVGRSPFGDELAEYAAQHTIQGRPIAIHYWKWAQDTGSCDMIFICESDQRWAKDIQDWCGGRPVLTICESARLTSDGIMIGLVLEAGRVKLLINRKALGDQGFSASSQLLHLAQLVGPESGAR
jgi:hypothetical protein